MNTFFPKDNDRKHTSNQQNSGWRKRGFLKMWWWHLPHLQTLIPLKIFGRPWKYIWEVWWSQRKKMTLWKESMPFGRLWRKCAKYIDHVHRVIPDVILNYGGPTQFWKTGLDEEPRLCKWSIPLTRLTLCQNQIW